MKKLSRILKWNDKNCVNLRLIFTLHLEYKNNLLSFVNERLIGEKCIPILADGSKRFHYVPFYIVRA